MLFPSISEETSSAESTVRVNGLCGRLLFSILSAGLLTVSFFGASLSGFAATDVKRVKERLVQSYGKMPLSFEPNRGQTSSEVQWVARGAGVRVVPIGPRRCAAVEFDHAGEGNHGPADG